MKFIKINGTKLADILGISETALKQKINGRAGDDTISSGDGNDKIKGKAGNDWIAGSGGNDDIDGGKGTDVAVYSGVFAQYNISFSQKGDKGTVSDSIADRDGTDSLKNVEFLKFSDGIYDVVNDTFHVFNRAPVLAAPSSIAYSDTAGDDTFDTAVATLSANDPDGNTLTFGIVGGATDLTHAGYNVSKLSGYGTLYLNSATGAYAFVPQDGAIEAIKTNANISFTLTASDGTAADSKTLTIALNGANDAAAIAGSSSGAVSEDGASTANGTLAVLDADSGDAQFQVPPSLTGAYGTFGFDAATGAWSYTLNNGAANVQALSAGATVHDTLTVVSADGTANRTIDVAVSGSNDAATIDGTAAGAVSEDGALNASGVLAVHDLDTGQGHFQTPASLSGTYGSFNFDALTGTWSYALNNGAANVQALSGGATMHDTLTVTSADGTSSRVIDVAVNGTNDAPTLAALVPTGQTFDEIAGLGLSGTMALADIDLADGHTISFQAQGTSALSRR